jgi:cyclophilin family peptidyl-prolyl cis-trans isomerase
VPTPAELDALEGAIFTIEMAEGGSFDLRLRAWDAPTNAARFARLADAGYFDGLTYHRVAPNFVIQGGSPAANEYAGDGPYTRDELGLDGHWRGTAGISTRGRDTGDAQMFVNLVDNVRLDHDYTVFGEVIRGMEVVDRVLEGAVIRQIRRTE